MRRGFLPGLAHFLDAYIIRAFTLAFYKRTGYIVPSVHDSVQLHPNFLVVAYEVLYDLYVNRFGATDWVDLVLRTHFSKLKGSKGKKVAEFFRA